eukprot:2794704-Ditylum_brightwellii.AAC.1
MDIIHPPSPIITTFESYLSTLDKWDALLLQEVELHKSVHKIAQVCHSDTQSIIIASDKSFVDKENVMKFGWRIVNKGEDILAEHAGPAFGQATSFCVESCGLLSVARCLHHISQYTNQAVQCEINIYIDNKGIVKRINDQLTYSHDCIFNTLEPDWDIVAQPTHTLKSYGKNLTIAHVKSHQDDKAPLDNLNLPARLNVAADWLATCYSLQQGVPSLEVPRMTLNCA